VQDKRSVRTRHLFEWGPDRPVLAPLQSEGAASSGPAPSLTPATALLEDTEDDNSEEEDVEDNRNAFTEEVEIGQDVEYIDGVDGADDQRIGERYGQIEVAIGSEADLREYNTDQGPRPKAVSHGNEYTYVASTPHFHPRAVPYPRSRYYTEAIYTPNQPQTLGLPRKQLSEKLHASPVDFARIIGIWALQQGIRHISTVGGAEIIRLEQKQEGMANGVYRDKKGQTIFKKEKNSVELYKPVIKFGSVAVRREAEKLFTWDKVSGHQSQDGADDLTQLMDFIMKHKITSPMTVAEWYTTPWHLAHLPITSEQMHLQGYETFSMCCRRCVRAFYEYETMHAAYFHTPTTFRALPTQFHRLKGAPAYEAPVPFHESVLWKRNSDPRDTHNRAVQPIAEADVGNPEHGIGGHHNWEIGLFDQDKREGKQLANNPEELRFKAHRNYLFGHAPNSAIVQGRANKRSKVPL
jgi:hypothetical protein